MLIERKIGLCSLNDPIDTTTPQGRLVFNMFASLAKFERDIIRERTQAGLSAARARGRLGGRPRGVPKESEATNHIQPRYAKQNTNGNYLNATIIAQAMNHGI